MIRTRTIFSLFAAAFCSFAAETSSTSVPTFWRYAHPEAKMLAGVDLSRISASAVGQRIKREIAQTGIKKMAADNGMGFFQNVDRVLISSTGEPGDSPKKQPPTVVAIQGKFDMNAFRREMTRKGAAKFNYKTAEIYRRGNTNDMVVAVVGPAVMLLGDGPSLKLAIDNHAEADPELAGTSLMRRAVELDQLYDVWFASEVSPASAAEAAGAGGPGKLFEETEGFEGGLSFKKGLGLDFALHNKSAEAAAKLATAMRLMLDLAPTKDPETDALMKKITIASDGQDVHLSFAYEEKEIMAGIDSIMNARMGRAPSAKAAARKGQQPVMTAAAAPAPPPPPPPPLVVKILNAEGGTREVLLQ